MDDILKVNLEEVERNVVLQRPLDGTCHLGINDCFHCTGDLDLPPIRFRDSHTFLAGTSFFWRWVAVQQHGTAAIDLEIEIGI